MSLGADGVSSAGAGPVVKICGLTRLEDILAAWELGAWALGFVFAPSLRRVTSDQARDLLDRAAAVRSKDATSAQRSAPLVVGVFGDVSGREVADTVRAVGLDAVQLHGRSGPPVAEVRDELGGWTRSPRLGCQGAAVRGELSGRPAPTRIIQAVRIGPSGDDPSSISRVFTSAAAEADLVLLDTRAKGRLGGSGVTFPWGLAREAAEGAPFLVAGGIDPGNVEAALVQSAAWGVDVSSGVESNPGVKDTLLMAALLARVHAMREGTSTPQEY